jgi:hypothetical protein
MVCLQSQILESIRDYRGLKKQLSAKGEEIDRLARELLQELQKQDGWECMIKACYEHYKSYPGFFDSCEVTHTSDAVQFVKGYSDGDEYEVLEISLKDSVGMQVRKKLLDLKWEKEQAALKRGQAELAELKRLKEKYEKED